MRYEPISTVHVAGHITVVLYYFICKYIKFFLDIFIDVHYII